MVDEKINERKTNRGIEPLPNLEFKFVCANTLIGLPPETPHTQDTAVLDTLKAEQAALEKEFVKKLNSGRLSLLERNQIEDKLRKLKKDIAKRKPIAAAGGYLELPEQIARLKDLRDKYFNSSGKAKKEIEKQFVETQKSMLLNMGADSLTEKLAAWEPFANKPVAWFDPDWMFGIKDGFDIVIANPPYVRQEDIKQFKPAFKAQYSCFTGTADLYVYFYERGFQLLHNDGILTYISSNKYFRSGYGEKLRGFMATQGEIHQLIDFGDAPVFTAIAYPSIIVVSKSSAASAPQSAANGVIAPLSVIAPSSVIARSAATKQSINPPQHQAVTPPPVVAPKGVIARSVVTATWQSPQTTTKDCFAPLAMTNNVRVFSWNPADPVEEFVSRFHAGSFLMPQSELKPDGWRLESQEVLNLLAKLRKAGKPLGEYVNGRFYRGILTGLNEAFVVDRATRDRLIAEHKSSAEVLKPFLRGRDVKRWQTQSQDLWLLFIPWHFPLHKDPNITGASEKAEVELRKKYPAVYRHLSGFKTALSARNIVETGIRYEWYALQRWGAEYWQEFEQAKIVIPAITDNVNYAPDTEGHFSNDKTSICITDKPNFLLALLNSRVLWWFIRQISASKQGGFYEFKPMYVSELPIPPCNNTKPLETLANKILTTKRTNPAADVSALEQEIDQQVYKLYNLTPAEITIIESTRKELQTKQPNNGNKSNSGA